MSKGVKSTSQDLKERINEIKKGLADASNLVNTIERVIDDIETKVLNLKKEIEKNVET